MWYVQHTPAINNLSKINPDSSATTYIQEPIALLPGNIQYFCPYSFFFDKIFYLWCENVVIIKSIFRL